MPDFDIYTSTTPGTYIKQTTITAADEDTAVTDYAVLNALPNQVHVFASVADAITEYVVTVTESRTADPYVP